MNKTQLKKVKEAVRVLYKYGFISQFERDSFFMRFEAVKKVILKRKNNERQAI